MKRLVVPLSLCLLAMVPVAAQQKKSLPARSASATATGPAAAPKICADPYQVREPAEGSPEAPVYILFHREKSKAPWARNPAIRISGLDAASPASARTLVCVEESRIEMGHYESGETGYFLAWRITLVRLADRKVYFMRGLDGEKPPEIKWQRGAGVGAPPTKMFATWLPLIVAQKVARLKVRLKPKEYHEASAMAFSADGSKLALAQEPRSTSSGTPPSPITVFDLATGQSIATWNADYSTHGIALSRSGNMVATDRYGHVEVWDVASGRVAHKLETSGVESLLFGPDDRLGAAGGGKAAVWDVATERALHTGQGSLVAVSPAGDWLTVSKGPGGITVQALESNRALATFPRVGEQEKYYVSGDAQAMARFSVLGATMYVAGTSSGHSLELPNLGVPMLSAIAPTRDGFVFANGDGIVGLVSASSPEPRVFATDHTAVHALAISPDGKLLAVGDSSGNVSVWELR
jgi:hypothetical protein